MQEKRKKNHIEIRVGTSHISKKNPARSTGKSSLLPERIRGRGCLSYDDVYTGVSGTLKLSIIVKIANTNLQNPKNHFSYAIFSEEEFIMMTSKLRLMSRGGGLKSDNVIRRFYPRKTESTREQNVLVRTYVKS